MCDVIYDWSMPTVELSPIWEDCFSRLPELESLRSVALIFDRHGGTNCNPGEEEDILQSRNARLEWIQRTFRVLGTRLRELSIRNFQDFLYFEELPTSFSAEPRPHSYLSDFVCKGRFEFRKAALAERNGGECLEKRSELRDRVLGGLESLRLSVTHEQIMGESDSHLKVCIATLARSYH